VNTGASWPCLEEAEPRVLAMQMKLHQWAISDPDRCFDDLFNLVHDPAFLVVAWSRVRGNKGGRTAGVDGVAPRSIVSGDEFIARLREDLKAQRFTPTRVREKTIPKASGKVRRLGIPTAADRVVQASLKLVLEPIFEADFHPCSYGIVRCVIEDRPEHGGDVFVSVDGQDLSLLQFARMFASYTGWGLRVEVVPHDELHRRPHRRVMQPRRERRVFRQRRT
jgi:hypothetical protein